MAGISVFIAAFPLTILRQENMPKGGNGRFGIYLENQPGKPHFQGVKLFNF
jgi:hypothetical protein